MRELSKVVLIIFYWMFPIRMWELSENNSYLWFFILSFLLTCATISHYENLAEEENRKFPERKVTVEDLYPNHDEERES